MFSPTLKSLGKRFALLGALMALMLGVGASSAFAEITLTPPGPYEASQSIEKVEVTEPPAGAVFVAIAECNVSGEEATWGTRCYFNSGQPPTELVGEEATFNNVPIVREFENYDFTEQAPGSGETTCKNVAHEGEKCAIVASYYKPKTGGGFEQFAQEKKRILFK